jgi:hypothetical protein
MKIYALKDMQSHSESVKKTVSLVGSVVLRGYETYGIIQLLEGSHRMAHAVTLGLPISIVLFNSNEVIPHDCDDVDSPTTQLPDYATAEELAHALIIERGLLMYKVTVYESGEHPNIKIVRPVNESGALCHARLINNSPFSAFPEKVWVITFCGLKDAVDKNILVLGKNRAAEAFKALGGNVTFIGNEALQDASIKELNDNEYDLIYAADIHDTVDLRGLLSEYKGF